MAAQISDVAIHELSLIFGKHKGESWAPVNGDARVLAVKGEPTEENAKKQSALSKALATVKAYFTSSDGDTWPVSGDVADTFDNDGDGAADYSAYALAIVNAAYDINSAMCMLDPARSAAIVSIIDAFRKEAAAQVSEKGGARHSAADKDHLAAIAAANKTIGDHLDALGAGTATAEEPADKGATDALGAFVPGELGDDGYPVNMAEYVALSEKAKKDAKKPYGDVEYADPENGKYPIDTKEHAKAAWSYINQEKNAAEYSTEDLKKVKDRIKEACEKFGIDISDKGSVTILSGEPSADESAEAIAKAVAEQSQTLKAELQTQIQSAVAEANERTQKAQSDLAAVRAELDAAKESLKAMVTDARKPSSTGFVKTLNDDGTHTDPAAETAKAEALATIGKPSTIAQVIALQRLAAS